jgi:hypothetical protein
MLPQEIINFDDGSGISARQNPFYVSIAQARLNEK